MRPEEIEPPTFGFVVEGRLNAGPLVFCVLARNHASYLSILSWVVCDTDVVSRQARTQEHHDLKTIQRKLAQGRKRATATDRVDPTQMRIRRGRLNLAIIQAGTRGCALPQAGSRDRA